MSSNLNRQNPTIAVPFVALFDAKYPKELKTLEDHLRRKRIDLGLLQQDVAQQLGVDEDSVCHWENRRSHPKSYLIPRVIDFLG